MITLLVRDYDETIAFFTDKPAYSFVVVRIPGVGKRSRVVARWRVNAPRRLPGNSASLSATKPAVFLYRHSDDFDAAYRAMKSRGVRFLEQTQANGMVAVFEDVCGNKWDLLELKRN